MWEPETRWAVTSKSANTQELSQDSNKQTDRTGNLIKKVTVGSPGNHTNIQTVERMWSRNDCCQRFDTICLKARFRQAAKRRHIRFKNFMMTYPYLKITGHKGRFYTGFGFVYLPRCLYLARTPWRKTRQTIVVLKAFELQLLDKLQRQALDL